MKQIVIISGKGGTGKTTLSASFCVLADNPVIVDCDVDASNMHLLLEHQINESYDFYGSTYAVLDKSKCIKCGKCWQACVFKAISQDSDKKADIKDFLCEGCGLCAQLCPAKAINMKPRLSGQWFDCQSPEGRFIWAKLGIGQENSGKLVSKIKEHASKVAIEGGNSLIISDGPPGTGCPVAATLSGANLALVVVEPSLSAMSDMKRVLDTAKFFKVPCAVIVNKWNLDRQNTYDIEAFCKENKIPCFGRISFSQDVMESLRSAQPLIGYGNNKLSVEIKEVWTNILLYLEKN